MVTILVLDYCDGNNKILVVYGFTSSYFMESSSCSNQVKKCCLLTQCHHFFSTTKILRAFIPLYKLGLLFLLLNSLCSKSG